MDSIFETHETVENNFDLPLFTQDEGLVRDKGRVRSSQGMKYDAEVAVLIKKIGSLESIRQQLGLSQRKIAQLLMVDPSAWTRWTRPGQTAPPLVYRALAWFLALNEKYPALDVQFWLNSVARMPRDHVDMNLSEIVKLQKEVFRLQQKLLWQIRTTALLAVIVLAAFILIGFRLL